MTGEIFNSLVKDLEKHYAIAAETHNDNSLVKARNYIVEQLSLNAVSVITERFIVMLERTSPESNVYTFNSIAFAIDRLHSSWDMFEQKHNNNITFNSLLELLDSFMNPTDKELAFSEQIDNNIYMNALTLCFYEVREFFAQAYIQNSNTTKENNE